MDLVAEEERELILEDRKRLIEESCLGVGVQHFQCFGTSIWDETLYKAWSEIVTNLIPNIGVLESHLADFCRICDADEVVLFERATFLVISHAQAKRDGRDEEGKRAGQPRITGSTIEEGTIASGNAASGKDGVDETLDGISTSIIGTNPDLTVSEESEDALQMSTSPPDSSALPIDESTKGEDALSPAGNSAPPLSPGGNNTNPINNFSEPTKPTQQIAPSPTPQFDAHRFEKISNIVKQVRQLSLLASSTFDFHLSNINFSNHNFTSDS